MKKLATKVNVIEVEAEGYLALLGEVITCFCTNYFYTGKLVGVNDTCILLESPKIVFDTGKYSNKDWALAEALPNNIYINKDAVEAFGIVK